MQKKKNEMTVSEFAKIGGNALKDKHGKNYKEYYSKIAKDGWEKRKKIKLINNNEK